MGRGESRAVAGGRGSIRLLAQRWEPCHDLCDITKGGLRFTGKYQCNEQIHTGEKILELLKETRKEAEKFSNRGGVLEKRLTTRSVGRWKNRTIGAKRGKTSLCVVYIIQLASSLSCRREGARDEQKCRPSPEASWPRALSRFLSPRPPPPSPQMAQETLSQGARIFRRWEAAEMFVRG